MTAPTQPQPPQWGQPGYQPPAGPLRATRSATAPPAPPPRQTTREEAFDQQLASYLSKGWRIESRTEHNAVLVKGKPVNHILHLLLSLVTVGLWIPVWIFLAVTGGEKRKHIAN